MGRGSLCYSFLCFVARRRSLDAPRHRSGPVPRLSFWSPLFLVAHRPGPQARGEQTGPSSLFCSSPARRPIGRGGHKKHSLTPEKRWVPQLDPPSAPQQCDHEGKAGAGRMRHLPGPALLGHRVHPPLHPHLSRDVRGGAAVVRPQPSKRAPCAARSCRQGLRRRLRRPVGDTWSWSTPTGKAPVVYAAHCLHVLLGSSS